MKPRVEDMTPMLRSKYAAFEEEMKRRGVPFALNCVLRTQDEQFAYVCQGRDRGALMTFLIEHDADDRLRLVNELWRNGMSSLEFINLMRKRANMCAIGPEDAKCIVTKTMNSRHFPGTDGCARAFDIVILKNGRVPTWDVKWDGDKDNVGDYEEAARAAETVGLIAGGHWKGTFQDWPHIELPR